MVRVVGIWRYCPRPFCYQSAGFGSSAVTYVKILASPNAFVPGSCSKHRLKQGCHLIFRHLRGVFDEDGGCIQFSVTIYFIFPPPAYVSRAVQHGLRSHLCFRYSLGFSQHFDNAAIALFASIATSDDGTFLVFRFRLLFPVPLLHSYSLTPSYALSRDTL